MLVPFVFITFALVFLERRLNPLLRIIYIAFPEARIEQLASITLKILKSIFGHEHRD